jgi:predicted DsbA family dithiol-disulfide isomerase
MTDPIRIDLFTDIVCPWCLIGTARLDQALAALGPDISVEIAHHPFLLDPTTPVGGQNTKERLKAKYGGDIDAMQARVEAAARDAGVALDLSVQPMSYPTVDAHTLIRSAPIALQYPLAKAFAAGYFLEGRNIADHEVLLDIAEATGQDRAVAAQLLSDDTERATTLELARSAAEQGISGVPFFIFNNRFAISGAQPAEVFARAFLVASGQEAMPA